MPELPEVETVRLQLIRYVIGKEIARVVVRHPKTVNHDLSIEHILPGQSISNIERVGKLLIFSFTDQPDQYLLSHLKMTGQFFYVSATGVIGGGHSMHATDTLDLPHKHTRVSLYFTDTSSLHFNDMRLFGYLKLATAAEVVTARSKFGPEPIAKDFDIITFTARLRKRSTTIKAALLDQTFIAGLGNIYVDEALFAAGVRPTRRANRVTKAEAALIATAASDIMNHSISVGGTTFQHFVDTGGQNGNYTDYLNVFGQQGTSCPRCGTIMKKIRCAGRGTHYCPGCQK